MALIKLGASIAAALQAIGGAGAISPLVVVLGSDSEVLLPS